MNAYAMNLPMGAMVIPDISSTASSADQTSASETFANMLDIMASQTKPAAKKQDNTQKQDNSLSKNVQTSEPDKMQNESDVKHLSDEEDLQGMISALRGYLMKLSQDDGSEMAALQQIMSMLSVQLQDMLGMASFDEMNVVLQQNGVQGLLEMMLQNSPELQEVFSQDVFTQLLSQSGKNDFLQFVQQLQGNESENTTSGFSLNMTQESTNVSQSGKAEMDFMNSVRLVKEQMASGTSKATENPVTDVEALQNNVNTGAFLTNTGMNMVQLGTEQVAVQVPVQVQVMTGVETAIQNGLETLTIKLAPEGLGELTIKLVSTGQGGMQLNIIAKSEEAIRMLGNEIDQLRDSLRPMKVEVGAVLSEKQYELLSEQQQRQNDQNQQGFGNMRGAAYYKDEPLSGQDEIGAIAEALAQRPQNMLDAYI